MPLFGLGLIKTLIDRAYKINNTTRGFHNDIKHLSEILKRNMFPKWLIDKSVKGYLSKVNITGKDASVKHPTATSTSYLISVILPILKEEFHPLLISIAKTSVLKLFSLHSNLALFSSKDFIPDSLKSRVVYQFTCASFGVRYVGRTNRHCYNC